MSFSLRNFFEPCLIASSALLAGLSLVSEPLWFLACIGPIPFLYVLFTRRDTQSGAHFFWVGLLFGTVFNATVALSAWSLLPLDWVGISSPLASFALVCAFWIGVSLTMGFAFAVFSFALFRMSACGFPAFLVVLATSFLWLGAEWAQSILSSLFMLGPLSDINTHFTLASLGYALGNANEEFWMALARWGGTPILSFSLVAFATSVALVFKERSRSSYMTVLVVVIVFLAGSTCAGLGAESARGRASAWNSTTLLTVVAVQTDFPPEFVYSTTTIEKKTAVAYEVAALVKETNVRPDVFILPEGIGVRIDIGNYKNISEMIPEQSLLIHSTYPRGEHTSRLVQTRAHTIGSNMTSITEKQFLMPYGEYPPYHFLAPLRLFAPTIHQSVLEQKHYTSGSRTSLGEARDVAIGVRICSEIFSPALYRELAERHNAGLLVHTSSIGIFHKGSILPRQMRAAARIRAVENGLPIIQSLNGGEGSAYDCRGKKMQSVDSAPLFQVYDVSHTQVCRASFFRDIQNTLHYIL